MPSRRGKHCTIAGTEKMEQLQDLKTETDNNRAEHFIAANKRALQALRELVVWPLLYATEASILGLRWPKGLLLYGPPGTGKTSLVHAVVRECGAHLVLISAGLVQRAYAGESERLLREAFAEASSHVREGKPAIIFIDEIDALCPRRDSRKEQESRLVAQILTLMDGIKTSSNLSPGVVVVASTNRLHSIDPALRRPGRFDAEIEISAPNEEERFEILQLHAKNLPLDETVDLHDIATSCNGYVGADLAALCREALMSALRKSQYFANDDNPRITNEDWEHARTKVGPSIVRGIIAEVPKVTWDDIGGLHDVKKKLQQAVEWPIKHANAFARLGISPTRGILLHGPPGCSKTTLVKAAARAAQANLFSLSGAELYSMYVGEGEALLRGIFQRARLAAPSIIFFDEADVVASKRGEGAENSGGGEVVGERLLSTLLTEIDGLEITRGVLVIGATNRPEAIDAALLRPGRFDLVLYVPPPDSDGRIEILRVHTRKMNMASDVDLIEIARQTEFFTGAELANLCREAGIAALREDIFASTVCGRHFEHARGSLKPMLTESKITAYSLFMKKKPFKSTR